MVYVVCAWCSTLQDTIEPLEDDRVSQTICGPCQEKFRKEVEEFRKKYGRGKEKQDEDEGEK